MKIAILSFYSGHFERGVETWAYELATRLSKSHAVDVFQSGKPIKKVNYIIREISVNLDKSKKDS